MQSPCFILEQILQSGFYYDEKGDCKMKRVKLTVAYDGTNYCGWQVQPNGITVQEVLNHHLSELTRENIETIEPAERMREFMLWEMWLFLIPMCGCRGRNFLML